MYNFMIFFISQTVSELGTSMTGFATVIWMYSKSGQVMSASLLAICSTVPYLIVSLLGGATVDKMNKKKISFEPIIEDLKEKFITKSDKPIHFTIDLKAKEVYVDEEFFKELMSNLIDNAIKYSKKSIEIKISSHYDDKYTIIKIYDNGMGISEKDQRTIFDKFERASATKRTKFGGATGFGLGLSLIHI